MRIVLIKAFGEANPPLGRAAGRRPLGSSRASLPASLLDRRLGLFGRQDGAEAMQVALDHGQDNIALETVGAMVGAAAQAMRIQGIDGQLVRGVLPAQPLKAWIVLARLLGGVALALRRQHRERDDLGQAPLVRCAVVALVETGMECSMGWSVAAGRGAPLLRGWGTGQGRVVCGFPELPEQVQPTARQALHSEGLTVGGWELTARSPTQAVVPLGRFEVL